MEPAEVLELIRSAPQRYDTVRAALRYRGYGSTIKVLRDRYLPARRARDRGLARILLRGRPPP